MIRSQPVCSRKRVVETVDLVGLVSRYLGMRPDVVYRQSWPITTARSPVCVQKTGGPAAGSVC